MPRPRTTAKRSKSAAPARKPAARARKTAETAASSKLAPGEKRRFGARLLKWYGENGRDLPWRKTSDPYRILVSEVMLQQTQVDRVIPKYHEFLERYPDFSALAQAPVEEVRETWRPLGYNIRPNRLHSIACETIERYQGQLPKDETELLSFKGLGRYTVGAIRSFAFNEDAPILDTNVIRVLHRVFIGEGDPKTQKARLWELSEALIPKGKGYDFNQAIMDFGATVCTARNPYCLLCPMKAFCKTYPFDARALARRTPTDASVEPKATASNGRGR
ncbi:MAG: A/G-specific adenine glycosylase [Nitrospiraceae bacterium]